uniref:(northern house mosquito) hypothetical protein n=1 Tax=Culex pipiens TaxID=7175 RepID=A0A8D8JU49_CULPI
MCCRVSWPLAELPPVASESVHGLALHQSCWPRDGYFSRHLTVSPNCVGFTKVGVDIKLVRTDERVIAMQRPATRWPHPWHFAPRKHRLVRFKRARIPVAAGKKMHRSDSSVSFQNKFY